MFFLILVLIIFDSVPHTVAVANAIGTEHGNSIPVKATVVDVSFIAIDDKMCSAISAMLKQAFCLPNYFTIYV